MEKMAMSIDRNYTKFISGRHDRHVDVAVVQ